MASCSAKDVEPIEDEFVRITAARRVMVSYDIDRLRKSEASQVTRFVFGRRADVRLKHRRKRYFYPGLVSRPGVEQLGQSVLIMREEDAEDMHMLLAKLNVPHRMMTVWVQALSLA